LSSSDQVSYFLNLADGRETSGAYKFAMNYDGPTVLSLSRQSLPQLDNSNIDSVSKGAYIIYGDDHKPDVILISSGSEVYRCIDAAKILKESLKVRVVR
jgi:transketolase